MQGYGDGRLAIATKTTARKRAGYTKWNGSCRRFGGLNQVRTDFFDDRIESRGVCDGQLAEHLAIQLDAGGDQCGDEPVVMHVAARGGRRRGA